MQPALSLVIPFHDVAHYLAICLNSVVMQKFDDFEVVLVDDGSTDGSRKIAEEYVKKDLRFHLLGQENRGPGAARNLGTRHARGRYLAFVDSDDMVTSDAYELLVGSLRASGSDLACGGVVRFDSASRWASPLHRGIFDEPRQRTHITERGCLLGDRTVWNKVYRRSFWDRHGFRFPDHPYEDGFVAVSAHVLAEAVDVLAGPVYFWRQRDTEPLSITQRTFAPENLDGRMKQVRTISTFLESRAPALKAAYDLAALEHDILILLHTTPHLAPPHRSEILAFARTFHAQASAATLEALRAENAKCYSLLSDQRTDDLFRYLRNRQPDALL
ncbi:glycosyltransferase family 2 protein [Streptomyces sp. NPDC096013]|uniref:glycosyltransferase family 2 protein n=1 Tax=Streptomyces sp. NPDC096013 TaxID=3366069 RepID=UPI0038024678